MLDAARSSPHVTSLRSPLPLLAGGILAALVLIVLVALPPRQATVDPASQQALGDTEAVTIVAQQMRSGTAALRVASEGKARFDDGSWYVTVGDASFHFTQRNRIVVADNDPARRLQFLEQPPAPSV